MDVNTVIISGILKGMFEELSNDGVKFVLAHKVKNQDIPEEFIVVAYGDSANFLKTNAQSGMRVVVEGRMVNEKLNTDNFHNVISVSRVLAITESQKGLDFNTVTVSGTGSVDSAKSIGDNGTLVSNVNIANIRQFKGKDGESREFKTFIRGTAWNAQAEPFKNTGNLADKRIVMTGVLKPREYTKNDDVTISTLDVWVNNIQVSDVDTHTAGSVSTAPKRTSASTANRTKPKSKTAENPF
jgi:single-stranded DNA-binding protein